jgi:hypothetical protein
MRSRRLLSADETDRAAHRLLDHLDPREPIRCPLPPIYMTSGSAQVFGAVWLAGGLDLVTPGLYNLGLE